MSFDDHRPTVQFHDRGRELRLFTVRDLDLRKAVPGHHPVARRYSAEKRRGGLLDRQRLRRACPKEAGECGPRTERRAD